MSGKQFFIDRYEKLGWSFHEVKARQAIRINESNAIRKNVLNRLKQNGVTLDRISFLDDGYWVRRSRVSVGATAEYLLGFYSIQEASAQIPATLFSDLKGKFVLDGKTVQLADLMENTGVIVALDVDKRRLSALANHLERCNVSNTVVYDRDARYSLGLKLKFDHILLDVPCSGNFVTDGHWFNRRTLRDVERNARLQREILTETCKCLKDEGEIIYSTCSLEPEEDELNVDWAIKNLDLEVEKIDSLGQEGMTDVFGRKLDSSISCCRRIWPGDTQGFFVSKLKKRGNNN